LWEAAMGGYLGKLQHSCFCGRFWPYCNYESGTAVILVAPLERKSTVVDLLSLCFCINKSNCVIRNWIFGKIHDIEVCDGNALFSKKEEGW